MSSPQERQQPGDSDRSRRRDPNEPVLPAQEARQGVTGQNVRYVLGFGLAAIVVAFVAIYLIYFG